MPLLFLLLALSLLPCRASAQSEVGLILNAVLQGLQAAEAIRQSVDRANQSTNSLNQPPGDPLWNYDEASLVPLRILRTGPYRNLQGQLTLSARQTSSGQIELLFYRTDGSISRREICRPDRRDGRRFDLDEKGKKVAEGPIRGGLPEGEWQFYTPEGKLKAESRMTAGKMTGPQTLFGDDGKPRASNTLLDGKREGPSTLFHPDGSVSDNLFYSADKLNGAATGWWPDGQPRYSATWKTGKLDGPSIENFPSGQKKSEILYSSGQKEGLSREWDEQGNLRIEENWHLGLREGPSLTYTPSGKKLSETLYAHGKKNGRAGTWSETGAKLSEGDWQEDQLEGTLREFYPDGKLRAEATYLHGKKEGPYKTFTPEGSLATSADFKEDKLAGPIQLHYPDGKPFAECHYDGDHLSGGKLFYPDGKLLGHFGPVLGKSEKVSSLMLQYPDGKPLSTARFDATTGKTEWQGWSADGTPLGTFSTSDPSAYADRLSLGESSADAGGGSPKPQPNLKAGLAVWKSQQESLEQQIGLSFPPEFNLLP